MPVGVHVGVRVDALEFFDDLGLRLARFAIGVSGGHTDTISARLSTATAPQGSVRDVTPTTRWLNAKERHTDFSTATFDERRGAMCDPGDCTARMGTGFVKVVTRKMKPCEYSLLYITAVLPPESRS